MPAQSGLAAGAQAGAAFGPWGAAIGGAAGLVGDIANSPTGPMISGGGAIDARSFMDGSGWTVSTGSSKATGGKSGGGSQDGGLSPPGNPASSLGSLGYLGASEAGMSPVMLLALSGVLLWAIL